MPGGHGSAALSMLTAAAWFVADSALEQRGFELAVPPRPARGATTFELHPGNAQETSGVEQAQPCRFPFRMGPRDAMGRGARNGNSVAAPTRWCAAMPPPNDLRWSLVALD